MAADSLVQTSAMIVIALGSERNAPDCIVVVLVVNQRWHTAIRVQLEVLRRFLLQLLRVNVLGLVVDAKLVEQVCDFPVYTNQYQRHGENEEIRGAPAIRTTSMRVEREVFLSRHIDENGRE